MITIQPAAEQDREPLLRVWLESVRATHAFLSEDEIQQILPQVRDSALTQLEVWVLHDDELGIVGFMGLDGASLEALFVAPIFFRRGGGKLLVEHARQLKGPLSVSVNEQNPSALAFYESMGFSVQGRSDCDGEGRPYPLLHLAEQVPA